MSVVRWLIHGMEAELASLRNEQDDEKLVIQSVFGDAATFATNVWKVWKPLDVYIHLTPVETESRCGQAKSFVSIDLHVVCTKMYPKEIPQMLLKNVKGISSEDSTKLIKILTVKANELKGSPMVCDLCSVVRDFLYEKNVPPIGSFHDGMLQKKANEENELKRQRLDSEAREKAEIEVETERREKERRRQKEEMEEGRRRTQSEADTQAGKKSRMIGTRKVIVEEEEGSSGRNTVHPLCKEWTGLYENEFILVSEWRFVHHSKKENLDVDQIVDRLEILEREVAQLTEMEDIDVSLVPLLFLHVQRISLTPASVNVKVFIGQRIAKTDRCVESINSSSRQDLSLLSRLSMYVLCALRWLHDQNIVHASVSPRSIWISPSGSFRTSDYVSLRLIQQVADAFRECVSNKESDKYEKPTKKRDLFALGTTVDKLSSISPDSSSDSSRISNLSQFIRRCQEAKVADELLDDPFLIQDIQPTSSTSSSLLDLPRQSRLLKEFLVFRWLGKGGFGEVTLARNKLDGNDYAVKRIALHAGKEKLNRRVTREAKLFSKLNHPNIVRYFAAWTEDVIVDEKRQTKTTSNKEKSMKRGVSRMSVGDSLLPSKLRQLEDKAAEMSEWTTSFGGATKESDSSDSEDSSLPVRTIFSPNINHGASDFDDVLFEGSGDEEEVIDEESDSISQSNTPVESQLTSTTEAPPTRILYIQMEYCEKGTLRGVIDRGELVDNPKVVWRLLGEILSGLQYIHQQGMIHRDIKPMNILLDSRLRAKIGDFGLATRQLLFKKGTIGGEQGDSSQTKDIGTELYMAPELLRIDDKTPYTNKIDVYSTGIILFEMFYRPLPLGMERISTLQTLKRTSTVPSDFGVNLSSTHCGHAKWLIESMVSGDESRRPTIESILHDDRLPLEDVEDEHFKRQFAKIVKKRRGRLFQWIMTTLTKEETNSAHAFCYDMAIIKERFSLRREANLCNVVRELSSLLYLHSFRPLSSPLLRYNYNTRKLPSRTKPVLMVDQAGYPVVLPMDLRENFVRLCARNAINRLKRFAIGRVFGYSDVEGGVHPSERWECSVDCIGTVSTSLTLSLSVLSVTVELANLLLPPGVHPTLSIGHMKLVRAALKHLGISEERHLAMFHDLSGQREEGKSESATISRIRSLLPSASTVSQLRGEMKTLLKSRDDEARTMAQEGMKELEELIEGLKTGEEMGASRTDIVLDCSLVSRPSVFGDGLVFQLRVEGERVRGLRRACVLLVGGRFDSSLERQRSAHDQAPPTPLCLVGFSLSLDGLVAVGSGDKTSLSVVISSYSSPFLHDKLQLASTLRKRGLAVDILHEPVDNIHSLTEHCVSLGVSFVLVFLSRDEILLNRLENEETSKLSPSEVVTLLSSLVPSSSHSPSDSSILPTTPVHTSTAPVRTMANVVVHFATVEKLAYNTRKRIEMQVLNILHETLALFKTSSRMDVIVVETPSNLLQIIAGQLSRSTTSSELTVLFDSLSKQHGKAKEDLEAVYSVLHGMFSSSDKQLNPMILFRYQDSFYRCII